MSVIQSPGRGPKLCVLQSMPPANTDAAYGEPAYGEPSYGAPACGEPSYGESTYGEPASGDTDCLLGHTADGTTISPDPPIHSCSSKPAIGGSGLTSNLLRAEDWGWRHAGRRAWAVRHLSFGMDQGERILLLGPSGAGKSTLLWALAGVLGGADEGEEEGSLTIEGRHPSESAGHAALMMQDPDSQIVLARIGDDVAFGCENMCVPPDQIWPRVRSSLDAVGLNLPFDHPTDHLSGGEQQRLVLAGALAMGAELLVLDEPTANLDPVGVLQVRDAVADAVADRTRSLIVVEHHSEIWADLADRVIVLTEQGVVADGAPDEIFTAMGESLIDMGVWVPERYLGHSTHGSGSSSGRLDVSHLGKSPLTTQPYRDPSATNTGHGRVSFPPRMNIPDAGPMRNPGNPIPPPPRAGHASAMSADGTAANVFASPILVARDLAIGYGTTAVRKGIDLEIPEGVSTVVTGPNGSGKSTLVLTLAGLLPALGGHVEAAASLAPPGRSAPADWRSTELLTRIGTVFQSPEHQFVANTVADEIAVGLEALKIPRAQITETVDELLETLRLAHLAKANPFTLSGGEKRRLSVATVLACKPRIIVLDEPTFGQDRLTWTGMVDLVNRLRDEGTTIISVTHDQAYVEALGQNRIDMGDLP